MNYITLERIVRLAACKAFGAKSENFDQLLTTFDPSMGIKIEGVNLGTNVGLSFDPSISPFSFFSSDVTAFVKLPIDDVSPASVQIIFGHYCTDVEAAQRAAAEFLDRDATDGWHVEDCFDENFGLCLRYVLGDSVEDDNAFAAALEKAFAELCDDKIADRLRPFVRYFEEFCYKIPENLSFSKFQSALIKNVIDAFYDDSDNFKVCITSDDYCHEYTMVDKYIAPVCLMGNHTPTFEEGFTLDVAFKSSLLPTGCTKMFMTFKSEGSVMTVTTRFGSKHKLSERDDSIEFVKPWHIRIGDSLEGKLVLKKVFVFNGEDELQDTIKELMNAFNSDKLYSYLACKGKVISTMKKHYNTNNH